LKTQRRHARAAGLDGTQHRALIRKLKGDAIALGYPTDLWTPPRVGELIEKEFGRRYSDTLVWRILKSMNWSCQRPTGRAMQRDEGANQEWKKKRWPALTSVIAGISYWQFYFRFSPGSKGKMTCKKKRDGRALDHLKLEEIRIHAVQREKARRTLSGYWLYAHSHLRW